MFVFLFVCCLASGCSKASSAKGIVKDSVNENNNGFERIQRVSASLSDRFRSEFKLAKGDSEEFISDLNAVLAEEKTFSSEDLSLLCLIDKKHPVSSDYVPKNLVPLKYNGLFKINRNDLSLRPDVYRGLEELAAAAQNDGITLLVSSSYRSYGYQKKVFEKWVQLDGLEEAERESARPGTSQHQLGSAVDFGSITDSFAETAAGRWLLKNAACYGWSLSFPEGYEDVTGYRWECWHFRYIGKKACAFQKKWFSDVQQFMLEFIDAWKTL